jgi:hypothetical protein
MKKIWLGNVIISMFLLSSLSAAEDIVGSLVTKFEDEQIICYSICENGREYEANYEKKYQTFYSGYWKPFIDPKTRRVTFIYCGSLFSEEASTKFEQLKILYERQQAQNKE